MRILAAAPFYEPEGGGLERYAHAILSRLAAKGHDVRAIALTRGAPGRQVQDDVDVLRVPPTAIVGNTPVRLRLRRDVTRAIREHRPDIVVAHTPVPFAADVAAQAARRARIPYVVTYHAGRLRGSRPMLALPAAIHRATWERHTLRHAAALIAVSPFVRDNALHRDRDRVIVIPPGVDRAEFQTGGGARAGLLFVGPVDDHYRWKGLDVALAAFASICSNRPGTTMTIVGDGNRRRELEEVARRTPGLTVVGRLRRPELVHAYQSHAVTLLPSTTDAEAFGMVLAEANACGCPVVASRIGGIPDFVRDGDNGLLARPGDEADLAAKVLQLLGNPTAGQEMGKRGRRRVKADHDWDVLAARTERVLAAAAARASSGAHAEAAAATGRPSTGPDQL